MPLEKLQQKLGYTFSNRALLLHALTHTSFGHEFLPHEPLQSKNNERLEFLGDAIIDLVVSDILVEAFPSATEGQLSKMRASVVNEKILADVALGIGVQDCIRLGKGETLTGGKLKPSIVSSCFEAIVAGIYRDGGFYAVYPVLRHLFAPLLSLSDKESLPFFDYKTKLQEVVQARFRVTPSYHLVEALGPDHAKLFSVEVRMHQKTLATSSGNSKKEAEQNAAKAAIESLK